MKNHLAFIPVLLIFIYSQNLLAADTLAIHDAILKKRISVAVLGNGGLGAKSARFRLKNNISADLNIIVPAGLMLNSEDEDAQDLIILEESVLFVRSHIGFPTRKPHRFFGSGGCGLSCTTGYRR